MLSIKEQLSILIRLSKVDEEVSEEEYRLIASIGARRGVDSEEIAELFARPVSIPELSNVPEDDKFEYIVNVIRLMKIDGRIHRKEIAFCEKLAVRLGYNPGVVAGLSAYVHRNPELNTDTNRLWSIANRYLIRKNEDDR